MKALVYTGPEQLELREVADPRPADGDVLLEINHVGICGSDMHAFLGTDSRRPAPLILGHEAAGMATDGRRYTVNPLVTCGTCEACRSGRENLCPDRQIISMPPREGAFAEQLAMPASNLVAIPDHVTTSTAALAEPIACGWHAVRLLNRLLHKPLAQGRGMVFGGGAIGLGAALVLAAYGVEEIWLGETNSARRRFLTSIGDFRVFDPIDGKGPEEVDFIIDGVGKPATHAAATVAVRPGGVIAHIGLGGSTGGFDIRRMTLQEITVIGTYTYTPADFRETCDAIFDGLLGELEWIEIRPLAEGARAFADIRAGRVAAPKVILAP